MSIAKYSVTAIDCPDPIALAHFYSKISGFEMEPLGDFDPVGHPFCLILNYDGINN